MTRHIDTDLSELKGQLLSMANHVEGAIAAAISALENRDTGKFVDVRNHEDAINRAHLQVDDTCVRLLATQQPMAGDLRAVVAAIKINNDLERMGDQAVNIANNTRFYMGGAPLAPFHELPEMEQSVRAMVKLAIEAFVDSDINKAREVLHRDDRVDELKDQVFKEVLKRAKAEPTSIEQALNLILIARNLERLGDHATNIAEDVIYMVSGEDIRHFLSVPR